MSFPSHRIAAAGVAALALGLGAGPALASTTSSATSPARVKTPLVVKLTADTLFNQVNYTNPSSGVDTSLYFAALQDGADARSVQAAQADSAQSTAKLEWALGTYLEARGDNGLEYGEQKLVYHHAAVARRAIAIGLADYCLANYYIADADSQLGVPHRALEAEPYRLAGRTVTAAAKQPYTAHLSTGSLVATIDSADQVIGESIPSEVRTTSVTLNEAAVSYYRAVIARLHVDGAQRPAQTEWAAGIGTLQLGDAQLAHAVALSGFPLSTNTRRAIASAFTTLRRANAQISRANALLRIPSRLTVSLPARISGLT